MMFFFLGFFCGAAVMWVLAVTVLFSCRKPAEVLKKPEVEVLEDRIKRPGLTMWE